MPEAISTQEGAAFRSGSAPPVPDDCGSAAEAFEMYFDLVWRSLKRLGVAPSLLDDAVQDVFVVVHRRWGQFERRSTVRTWTYGICLRVASDYRRRRSAGDELAEERTAASGQDPEQLYQRRQAGVLLHALLGQLKDWERDVFVLVELEQMSVPEACSVLGLKLNTGYGRLRKARQHFNDALMRHKAATERSGRSR